MLCHKWPLRWDHYVLPASWIQRVTPETSLSANMAPFRILVGRDARTRIDTMTLSIDEGEFRGGFDNFEVDKLEAFMEVRDCLLYTSPSPRDRTRSRMPRSRMPSSA